MHWLEHIGHLVLPRFDYNLLGNVHWLELSELLLNHLIYYNLLGNVHWLEREAVWPTIQINYNLLGNVHWLELAPPTAPAYSIITYWEMCTGWNWLGVLCI